MDLPNVSFKVLQINARRSSVVMEEISRLVSVSLPMLVFIQEPHIGAGGIFPLATGYSWCAVGVAPAVITFARGDVPLMGVPHLSDDHTVVARVIVGSREFTTVNCYWRYGLDVEPQSAFLDDVLSSLNSLSSPVLLVGDFNGKSPLWFSDRRDRRGDALVGIASQYRLGVANEPGHDPTWTDGHGNFSNIDVTLSRNLDVFDWRTAPSDTSSDHSAIWFKVGYESRSETEHIPDRPRFRLHKANWPAFRQVLVKLRTTLSSGSSDAIATLLSQSIINAAKETIPVVTGRKRPCGWWDEELVAARRLVQRRGETRRRSPTHDNLANYRCARNHYVGLLRQKKADYLARRIQSEGNREPFRLLDRLLTPASASRALSVLKTPDGLLPDDIPSAMRGLLDALLPMDDQSLDDEYLAGLRSDSGVLAQDALPDVSAPTKQELDALVARIPNRRAPGPDNVTPELLKAAWAIIGNDFLSLCHQSYSEGHFPRPWKEGTLTLIPKSNAPGDTAKSFRPLTLLSIPGKLFERTICSRLTDLLESTDWISSRQFGFLKGKGSVDALLQMKKETQECSQQYVLAVFLDIAGAFDSAWWPIIHERLRYLKCPHNLHRLINSYLQDRELTFSLSSCRVRRVIDQGCPQGSILGPTLWLIIINTLLIGVELPRGVKVNAYADDVWLMVMADSRKGLEDSATAALTAIFNWGVQNRLSFAPHKSCCTLLKGKLQRRPLIFMNTLKVKYVTEHKHLGVLIGERWQLDAHVREATDRALRSFYQCVNLAQRKVPGFSFRTLKLIYHAKFVSIALYAAPVWASNMKYDIAESLLRSQRLALLQVTRAYRTVSRPALHVLAGLPPLDLLAVRLSKDFRAESSLRLQNRKELLNEWQKYWEQSDKGRYTFYLFPSVTGRLSARFFFTDRLLSQVFSGHGAFREYLARRCRSGSPVCLDCGAIDTSDHALLFCPAIPAPDDVCLRLMLHASTGVPPLTPVTFEAVRKRAQEVLRRRELLRV